MNYSQEDFLALIEEVEFQGGTHLDESHDVQIVKIRARPKGRLVPHKLARCGHAALFEVPYGLENPSDAGEVGIIKVCAVDDNVGAWPRFKHALEDGSNVSTD